MSITTEVQELTTATNNLIDNVNARKSQLTTPESNAKTSAESAEGSVATIEGYSEDAQRAAKEAYAAYKDTVALTSSQDLDAISDTITATAVSMFVYDTSKDSDGGAWRYRTEHTSWYNEPLNTTTRGSRREFPAVAVIVAEDTKVTIYDGDDPTLPMWMVFTGGASFVRVLPIIVDTTVRSVYALNGNLGICLSRPTTYHYLGLSTVNFISDSGIAYSRSYGYGGWIPVSTGGIADRDSAFYSVTPGTNETGTYSDYVIISGDAVDVAMTVLPDAPIDPKTGLPVPTIAVATSGGLSIINGPAGVGTVRDIVDSTRIPVNLVHFDGLMLHWVVSVSHSSSSGINLARDVRLLDADLSASIRTSYSLGQREGHGGRAYPHLGANAGATNFDALDGQAATYFSTGGASRRRGLLMYYLNDLAFENSMVAYISKGSNSGWVAGDARGCYLSSTNTATLNGYGSELIANGTFVADVASWTANDTGTITWDDGSLKLYRSAAGTTSGKNLAYQTVNGLTIGQDYVIQADFFFDSADNTPANTTAWISFDGDSESKGESSATRESIGFDVTKKIVFYFTATATSHDITLGARGTGVCYVNFDNISLREYTELLGSAGDAQFTAVSAWSSPVGSPDLYYTGQRLTSASPRDGNVHSITTTLTGIKTGDVIAITADVASISGSGNGPYVGSSNLSSSWTYFNDLGVSTAYYEASVDDPVLYIQTRQDTEWELNSLSVKLVGDNRFPKLDTALDVYGDIDRTAVATGAELVGYNFTDGHLELPDGLDFGTGDFSASVWYYSDGGGSTQYLYIQGGFYLGRQTTSAPVEYVYAGIPGRSVQDTVDFVPNVWAHLVVQRRGSLLQLYKNGVKVGETTNANNSNNSIDGGETMYFGNREDGLRPMSSGSRMALLRFSATSMTEEQIKKSYNDEKHLFQENAKCVLAATVPYNPRYDRYTNLLHVGLANQGRQTFFGLRSVDYESGVNTTKIAVNDGLLLEE